MTKENKYLKEYFHTFSENFHFLGFSNAGEGFENKTKLDFGLFQIFSESVHFSYAPLYDNIIISGELKPSPGMRGPVYCWYR